MPSDIDKGKRTNYSSGLNKFSNGYLLQKSPEEDWCTMSETLTNIIPILKNSSKK